MSRDFVDVNYIEVNSSQGSKEVTTAKSFSITVKQQLNPVKTMNRKRTALGYKKGTKEVTCEIEDEITVGAPDVDWRALKETAEVFQLKYEETDGGRRFRVIDCVVEEITKKASESGDGMLTVRLTALDHQPE